MLEDIMLERETAEEQWGTAQTRVKTHRREYKTGAVDVSTFSAKCPKSPSRKRLSQVFNTIYEMRCGENNTITVEVNSGNYVNKVIPHVDTQTPVSIEFVDVARYFDALSQRTGIGRSTFAIIDVNHDGAPSPYATRITTQKLTWDLTFTDSSMTEGVGIAIADNTPIFVSFVL